ncbi:helix-turn-helix domain-containing protein [Bombella apis]|uniref:helix-turn-helix domain-containing protein n=1 Tax=Bombella apis TaxID=1785988 RepID=UPI0012B8454D|nr:helix-turn-helix domain-containing protein [Bombella apis]
MKLITYPQIAALAQEKNLSLNELARRAGIARSVLDRWRSGKTTPTLRTVGKIQDALSSHPTQRSAS